MARYALIIGISQYSNLSPLPTPTNDAEAIAQILEKYGNFQQVKRYPYRRNTEKNNQPEIANQIVTGISVMQQLREFLAEQAEDSEALIYFTGHGIEVKPVLGNSEGFLAASDCQLERDGSQIIGQKNGILFSKLNEEIRNSHLSSLVVILDCCHSGYFIERNLLESSFTFSAQRDYYLIAGCRSFQQGKIIKGESHSVFTTALIQALSEQNADKKRGISGDRLFDCISRELQGSVQEAIRFGWGKSIQLFTYPHNEHSLEIVETILNRDNPYLGLKSFESTESELFYGRENAVRALLDRLTNSRFVAVIGASGCGKSSLVKAGLLPELSNNYFAGSGDWKTEILTPGSNPLYKLQEIIEHHLDNQPYILFIDQFEEVFTLTQNKEERNRFIQLIANEVINPEKQTRVIIAMRGDFLDKCAEYPEAANLINQNQLTSYLVQPLSLEELEEAIEQPAKLHGVTIESGLVFQIIDDVAQQPGALPLMQYALKELWDICLQDKSNENPQLTLEGYTKIGGVKGALEKTANRLYDTLTSEDDKKFIRRLFTMELVYLGDGKEVTRKRVSWERLRNRYPESQLNNIINRLVDARLIVTTEKTVEVAHEALFSEWSLLKDWITESRDDIRLSQSLERYCREWQEIYHKSDDALLTGAILAAVEEWKARTLEKLPSQEEEYIRKSLEKRDKEQQETIARIERELEQEKKLKSFAEIQVKIAKYQRNLSMFVSVLLIFSGSLVLLSYTINQQKKEEEYRSVLNLVDQAKSDYYDKHDQLGALMTSIRALDKLNKIDLGNTRKSKVRDDIKPIVYGIKEQNRLEGHKDKVWSISISPDGNMIVSASADKTINIWSIKGKLLDTALIQAKEVNVIRFSNKNNNIIVSGSADGYISLWKIFNNKLIKISTKKVSNTYIYDLAFSQDDSTIAFSCADGTINTVKLSEYSQFYQEVKIIFREVIDGNSDSNNFSLDFNPKANIEILAYSYKGSNIHILNLKNNQKLRELISRDNTAINKIRFSPDGKLLAFAKNNGEIKILDISKNYNLIGEIKSEQGLLSMAFNKNNLIATSYRDIDKGIIIWDIDKIIKHHNKPMQKSSDEEETKIQLLGHQEDIKDISFSLQDPSILVSASGDTTIRIWHLKENPPKGNLVEYSCLHIRDYLLINLEQKQKNVKEIHEICQQFF